MEVIKKHFPPLKKDYGCEVVKDLKRYESFFKKLDLRSPLWINRRDKGITGSGIPQKCHGDSFLLKKLYGGNILHGYAVSKEDKGIVLYHHSVWITPEGNAVDISTRKEHCVKRDDGKMYVRFIPITEYDGSDIFTDFSQLTVPYRYQREEIRSSFGTPQYYIPNYPYRIKYKNITQQLISYTENYVNEMEEFYHKGGFTEPSMFTGLTYEESLEKYGVFKGGENRPS